MSSRRISPRASVSAAVSSATNGPRPLGILHARVVAGDEHAVGGQPAVDLQPAQPPVDRRQAGGQRVLGVAGDDAAPAAPVPAERGTVVEDRHRR
jgi:hypothetical protein